MRPNVFGTMSRWTRAICFLLLVTFSCGQSASAQLQSTARASERIEHFDVDLTVHADSSLTVRETIRYNFEALEKHGIFRDIPVKYRDRSGATKNTQTKIESVVDENGGAYPYSESTNNGMLHLKIGDPARTVSGVHTYRITYSVRSALGYFSNFDELYWNITGNGWPVTIEATAFKITVPQKVVWRDWRFACYVGPFGSTESCGSKNTQQVLHADDELVQSLAFESERLLNPGEGITVAFGFPKGIVREPSAIENMLLFVRDNPLVLLPPILLVIMFRLWYTRGRDPKGRGVIVPEYAVPEGLSPLEIAGLMNGRVTGRDIPAAVIDLAVKGYLRIEKKREKKLLVFADEDYVFSRLEKTPPAGSLEESLFRALFSEGSLFEQLFERKDSLHKVMQLPLVKYLVPIQKTLVGGLDANTDEKKGKVKLSDLKNKFYSRIPSLQKEALDALVKKGWYAKNPADVFGKYVLIGVGGLFVLFFLGSSLIHGGLDIVFILLSAAIFFIFAYLMPRVTKEGALLKEKLRGLKEYLQIAEKNRIEFHNAPERTPELFETLLPAAMLLGVTALWAKEFEGLLTRSPEWYSDMAGTNFSALSFSSSLNSFSSVTSSTFASSPSGSGSGGGGSSGGGGGGGGGGSW